MNRAPMDKDLPRFRRVKRRYAASIVHSVLSNSRGAALLKLHEFDDGRFRAVFAASYFETGGELNLPSKSQWNTLKKKLKRRDRSIFVLRRYGEIGCEEAGAPARRSKCLFLEFGFLHS